MNLTVKGTVCASCSDRQSTTVSKYSWTLEGHSPCPAHPSAAFFKNLLEGWGQGSVCVCSCGFSCVHFAPLPHLLFILPCRCLFVDFLLRSGSSHHLHPFLLLFSLPPLPLLPPCSLIPPFPPLFQCHLVSYVRIMGGEWIWCSAVIRVTRRCSPALAHV